MRPGPLLRFRGTSLAPEPAGPSAFGLEALRFPAGCQDGSPQGQATVWGLSPTVYAFDLSLWAQRPSFPWLKLLPEGASDMPASWRHSSVFHLGPGGSSGPRLLHLAGSARPLLPKSQRDPECCPSNTPFYEVAWRSGDVSEGSLAPSDFGGWHPQSQPCLSPRAASDLTRDPSC